MRLQDLNEYVSTKDNLQKITIELEENEEIVNGSFFVTKTKETYVFYDEEDADRKINDARQDTRFAAAEKKYKQGKINKAGEIVKPETWTVVIKLNH